MNPLTEKLEIDFPLIQAGMGGVAGSELAAAVSTAGAGGVVALYRSRPRFIHDLLGQTQHLTARAFGVNLIPELMDTVQLTEQVDAVLHASRRNVFFFFFGLPTEKVVETITRAERAFLIMVGSVCQMKAAEELGATAIILQGIEAGGHLLGNQPLLDLTSDALTQDCKVPLVVAGGISSGHEFRIFFDAGLSGCLCGTLFVATNESLAHPNYKQRLTRASSTDTVITSIFDIGWPNRQHRVLHNRLTTRGGMRFPTEFIAQATVFGKNHPIPRYSAVLPSATTVGKVDEMAMYCGTSVDAVTDIVPASRRVKTFIQQFHDGPTTYAQTRVVLGRSP